MYFQNKVENGHMTTVGIIGLGYVGLPTAIGFHDAGFNVWGVDVSQRTVDMVKAGENPTGDPDVDDIVPAPGTGRQFNRKKIGLSFGLKNGLRSRIDSDNCLKFRL